MKKQILTIASLIGLNAMSLHSQVTLTQSNHAPVPGDVNSMKEFDTTGNILTTLKITGNGVTWDFTGKVFSNGNYFSDVYVNPTSLPGSSTFTNAGATVAFSDSSDFYKASATKLEYLGGMNASGEVQDFTSNPPDLMHYPFSYGSSYTDVGSGTMTAPGMPPFNLTGTITVSADGQGTLILPSNPNYVYNNVLKVHSYVYLLIQGTGSLSTTTGTQTIDMYDFYISGQKFPIFEVQYHRFQVPSFGINDFNVSTYHTNSITLGISNNITNNTLSLFPNPVSDKLYISGLKNQTYDIHIYNIVGEENKHLFIDNSNNSNLSIDVSDLSNGIYFIQISNNSTSQILKFIKN